MININKKNGFMKIFAIWIGVICCGIANGLLFSWVSGPEKIVYISIISFICWGLLSIHKKITEKWNRSFNLWSDSLTGYHFPIFRVTLVLSFALLIVFIFDKQSCDMGVVACITIVLASMIAYKRELRYTDDWI